jgi:hypothetical protein
MTVGPGEPALSEWMSRNAVVAFHECEKPSEFGSRILGGGFVAAKRWTRTGNHSFDATLTKSVEQQSKAPDKCPYSSTSRLRDCSESECALQSLANRLAR